MSRTCNEHAKILLDKKTMIPMEARHYTRYPKNIGYLCLVFTCQQDNQTSFQNEILKLKLKTNND